MTVVWSPTAAADLERLADRAELFSQGAGTRLKIAILSRLSQLDQPFSGRKVPEYEADLLRELIAPPYRIIYEVFPDRVEIVTIRHSAELLSPPTDQADS